MPVDRTSIDADELGAMFELVANDTRIEILHALWDERSPGDRYISFSELRERAGVSDGGRFNYHLGKLVPEFVRKRDAAYTLTHAGEQLIGDAVSGTYTGVEEADLSPTVVSRCYKPGCDGNTEVEYRNGKAIFSCDSCDRMPDVVRAPPIVVGSGGRRSAPDAASRFSLLTVERGNRGFCHLCDGPVEQTVAASHPDYEPTLDGAVDVIHECQTCGTWRRSGAATALVGHPAVVSLLYAAGIDYRSVPHWEQTWLTESTERLVGEDPVRLEVTTVIDGDEHAFTLDEGLDVIERE
jgi:hypothetical protein